MPMGEGFWLNPRTGKVAEVTHHEKWIYDEANARDIGLSKHAFDEIRKLDVNKAIDEIRIIAIMDGLVRIRDYQSRVAIQFYAERNDVRTILWAVHEAMKNIKSLRSAWDLVIGNLKTKEDVEISKKEFDQKLENEEPIMMFERKNFDQVAGLIESVEKKLAATKDFDVRKVPNIVERIETRLAPKPIPKNYKETVDAVGSKALTEASLSRILRHINMADGFAIISANRSERTSAENAEAYKQLQGAVRSQYGYIRLSGKFKETLADGSQHIASEPSLFIPKMTKDKAIKIGQKFGQEAIIWGDDTGTYLVWMDGRIEKIGTGKLSFSDLESAYSELKGRQFKFEHICYCPNGMLDGLVWHHELLDMIASTT